MYSCPLIKQAFALAFVLILSLPRASGAGETLVVAVHPEQTFQTIHGWEATVNASWPNGFEARSEELFRRAVEEVGISRIRLGVFAGSTENTDRSFQRWLSGEIGRKRFRQLRYATVNDNDDPYVINPAGFDFANLDWRIDNMVLPMKRLVEARGEKLFINLNYVAFTDQIHEGGHTGRYHHDDPEEYAEFVLATYLHMQEKYGFVPDAWEVILEPDLVREWKRDPRLIGLSMVAAARRLREHGFEPAFIAPSVTDMNNAVPYLRAVLSVPGAREVLSEVSYHRYRHGNKLNLRNIAERANVLGVPPAMLEYWFGKADQKVLYTDLTIGENGIWAGRALLGNFRLEGGGIKLTDEVRHTSLHMAFVRPGAVRIGTETNARNARSLAFLNPDGSETVVVQVPSKRKILIKGLGPGPYRIFYATSDDCGVAIWRHAGRDGQLDFVMPGEGTLAATSFSNLDPAFLTTATSSRCRHE